MIDRKKFFDAIRGPLFYGNLTQGNVDGIDTTLDLWEDAKVDCDPRAGLAYVFATNWWEARLPPDWKPRMQPVEEYGKGAGLPYGKPDPVTGFVYYGRGDVQLTWADNYKRLGNALGIDLYRHPELALDPLQSKRILVNGMLRGLYTPSAGPLKKYFPVGGPYDWTNARRMVNGTDKAAEIAALALKFHKALLAA